MLKDQLITTFAQNLIQWHSGVDRDLPWKKSRDPYVIYVSEIILQQTRVEQGTPYFFAFIEKFPTVERLAKAKEDEVFSVWQGLGYYSRARNMMRTAKIICENYGGSFPSDYEKLKELPGIGPYTAAAIASFAFKLSHAVVDGNVLRLVSRLKSISAQIEKEGKKQIHAWVNEQIKGVAPDNFNQAIMDLGALICKPKNPACNLCPFSEACLAHKSGMEEFFPVKKTRAKKRERYLHFFLLMEKNKLIIRKRTNEDIWKGLYELPVIETESSDLSAGAIARHDILKKYQQNTELLLHTEKFTQELSHQRIHARFYKIPEEEMPEQIKEPYYLVERKNLNNYAFPKVLDWYLSQNSIYLIN